MTLRKSQSTEIASLYDELVKQDQEIMNNQVQVNELSQQLEKTIQDSIDDKKRIISILKGKIE